MNEVFHLVFVLFLFVQINAQEKNAITKSVKLERFIPFIAENYSVKKDTINKKKIIILIPVSANNDNDLEKRIIIRLGARLLLERLSENDEISFVAYGELVGEILPPISPKKVKEVLYALKNLYNNSTLKKEGNGILLAYDLADKYYEESAISTIIMIRDLKESKSKSKILSENIVDKSPKNKLLINC